MTDDMNGEDPGRGALRAHLSRVSVPAELDQRVRATLESRGLVRPLVSTTGQFEPSAAGRRQTWALLGGLLAAGFLLGALTRGALGNRDRPGSAAAAGQYVLLLYGDPPGDTGAVHVTREREYGRWASSLTDGARWVGGHELADVIESLGPSTFGAPYDTARLAGYFVIEAPSRERAAEVARSCPHLKYGGRVVVMAIAG